jgi:outer membrane protein assembly factor BamB
MRIKDSQLPTQPSAIRPFEWRRLLVWGAIAAAPWAIQAQQRPGGSRPAVAAGAQAGSEIDAGWSRFKGPNGTGLGVGKGFPSVISEATRVWGPTPLPGGHSSPVFTSRHIFVNAEVDRKPQLICFDRATGRQLWARNIQTTRESPIIPRENSVASGTPATDGSNVYAFFNDFGLISFDSNGKQRWATPMGPFTWAWGNGTSPVLVGKNVILQIDGYTESYIAAFDRETGKQVWRTDRAPRGQTYSTPVVRTTADLILELLAVGPGEVTGYNAVDGKRRWGVAIPMGSYVASLAVAGDVLIATNQANAEMGGGGAAVIKKMDKNGDGRIGPDELTNNNLSAIIQVGSLSVGNKDGYLDAAEGDQLLRDMIDKKQVTAIRLNPQPDGTVKPERIWTLDRNVPWVPSPLVYDGLIYILTETGILTTIDAQTGPTEATQPRRIEGALGNYSASPVAAEGKVYLASEDGVVTVLQAGHNGAILSQFDTKELIRATPALVDGRVFVRTAQSISAFGERGPVAADRR